MWPGPVCAWQRQSSSRQHAWSACEHLIGSQLVVMVLRTQWPLGTIAQFFHFVAEEKKKTQKNKGIYDWATRGIPVKSPKHKRVSIPIKQHINETRALTSQFKLTFSTDSVFFPVPFCFSVIPEPFFLPRKRYYQSENLFAFLSIAIVTTKEFHLRMRY